MNLFEIKQEILSLVDPETGEIADTSRFDELQMARDEKLENIALWIKNLNAEAEALSQQKQIFAEREKQAKNRVESLKNYLSTALDGQDFKTDKVLLSWRKSVAVEVDPFFIDWAKTAAPELIIEKAEPNKNAIKDYLQCGVNWVEYASLVERRNLQIK